MAFQTQYGLEPTGVLNRQSANMLLSVYRDTRAMATENGKSVSRLIYPGRAILRGRTGADVEDLQSLINRAAAQNAYPAGRGRRDLRRGNGECREGRAGARGVRRERHRRAADVAGFAAA